MSSEITLVDRGRGMQLSTSRITVLDLVPYFQERCSYEEIMRWLPTLNREEIAVAQDYYHDHQDELDRKDRGVREYRAEQIRLQDLRFHKKEETPEECMSRLKGLLHRRHQEANGEGHSR